MTPDFEVCKSAMEQLTNWAVLNVLEEGRNEATTRLHLIDRFLFECLGWAKEDCSSEESFEGTYTDYLLGTPSKRLVVEAKKEGVYFSLPAGFHNRSCEIKTLTDANPGIDKAIRQVLKYSQDRGIPIAAVCNGHQVLAFLGSRQDGVPPTEGRAIVFSSLEDMLTNFKDLWQCLSKPGIANFSVFAMLRTGGSQPPPAKLSDRIEPYPGFKSRNELQTELQILGDIFLEDIAKAPEIEDEFLKDCYCPSGALSQYALISKQILEARYSILFQRELEIPSLQGARTKSGLPDSLNADILAASVSRRPIILLGDVGVGKTIFIRHFIKVEAKEVFERALVLYIDFGKEPALAENLESFVLKRCASQLLKSYSIDIEERNFVRGVYHFELERFSKSVYSDLKEIDKSLYVQKEMQFLEKKLEDRDAHLRACLEHIMRGQLRQIVIFLDNVDQREFEFQEKVFLIGHSLAETWPGTVFISLRPDTFFRSRAKGSLTAYQPRVFAVAPPRTDLVITKRLRFAFNQLERQNRLPSFPEGLWLHSITLKNYLRVLLESFEGNEDLMELVDNLSGGNTRQALDFVAAFVGSGHVDTQKILASLEETGTYKVALHEFMRAVIYGDHEHFDPTSSPIVNLFDISTPDGREHFLLGILLSSVQRLGAMGAESGFVDSTKIYEFCQSLGYQPAQIQFAIERAQRKKLIEPSPRFHDTGGATSFRITTVGAYTSKRLAQHFAYVDAMIVDTPVTDGNLRKRIKDRRSIEERIARCEIFRDYLDTQFAPLVEKGLAFDWQTFSEALGVEIARIKSIAARKKLQRSNFPIRIAEEGDPH
jgi:hypothetical protein